MKYFEANIETDPAAGLRNTVGGVTPMCNSWHAGHHDRGTSLQLDCRTATSKAHTLHCVHHFADTILPHPGANYGLRATARGMDAVHVLLSRILWRWHGGPVASSTPFSSLCLFRRDAF